MAERRIVQIAAVTDHSDRLGEWRVENLYALDNEGTVWRFDCTYDDPGNRARRVRWERLPPLPSSDADR
jgi:hypothetical protein